MTFFLGALEIFRQLGTFFMIDTCRLVACLRGNPALEEEHLAFWRVLSPKQEGVVWMLA
jgi:hypothetical protein